MINAQTQLYGLIGNPVGHSLSPIIHNGAFRRMGINAVYLAFKVRDLSEAIGGIRGLGLRGVSVTIPFKTQIIPFLDLIDSEASRIKAVNTVSNEDGKLIGHNTDCRGAVEALEEHVDLPDKKVLLLGAGGAARAIAFGLKEKNCQVFIANRTRDKAKDLAAELEFIPLSLSSIGELKAQIIVNTTSVGMFPEEAASPLPKEILQSDMTVMDIVYKPLQTKLLREAKERGCRTINGLEMLARQGAAQLEIWTGRKIDIGEIREELRKVLA